MQPLITTTRRLPDMRSAAFLVVAFLSGIAGALQTPTLSLFLSTEVHARPFMVGLFFTASAITGIIVSQVLAGWSDKQGDRRRLIFQCCLAGALASLLFAFDRHYFILLFIGVLLSSFGNTANPQMFALAREHAEQTGRTAVIFSSIMRAQISLAWVIGPPAAFAIALGYSFTAMYVCAALAYFCCAAIVFWFLPSSQGRVVTSEVLESPRRHRRNTLLLFIACTLMWACNSNYLIAMPLYLVHERLLPEALAGKLMGLAAGLEIPVMLLAGMLTNRLGKRAMMRFATFAGVLFYLTMAIVTSPQWLMVLQLLNAIFIGILAGIGMVYFQDLMPGQAGAATTLFTNTTRVGWIIAGSLTGAIGEWWNYHLVFYINLAMMIVTLGLMWRIKDVRTPSPL